MRSRHAASARLDARAPPARGRCGRRRSAAELVPRPVDGRRADVQRRHDQRHRQRLDGGSGSTISPMPRHAAPARRRGRTARRRRAGRRGRGRRRRPSAARRRRRPSRRRARRRGGSACRSCTAARAPGERAAPWRTRFESSVGTPSANGPSTVIDDRPPSAVDRQLVGQVERHHLGVDEVVAVVAHAGDAQRQRELGRRRDRRRVRHAHRRAREPAPSRRRASSSGRAVGATPAAANCSGVDDAAERARAASCAAGRTPAHEREQRSSGRRPAAARGGRSRTSADSTFGRGTNTVAGT